MLPPRADGRRLSLTAEDRLLGSDIASPEPTELEPNPNTLSSAPSSVLVCPGGQFTRGPAVKGHTRSYMWYKNSCFIDCLLELLFRAYVQWPPAFREDFVLSDVEFGTPLGEVFWHFRRRFNFIVSQPQTASTYERDLAHMLVSPQAIVRHAVYNRWNLYNPDTFGDTVHVMCRLLKVSS